MLICILGSLGSGKTSICNELSKHLPEYHVIMLDEYRKKYNKYCTIDGETDAQLALIEDMGKYKNIILECTGTGEWFNGYLSEYRDCFPGEGIKKFKLDVPIAELARRIEKRKKNGYVECPFPYESLKNKDIFDSLKFFEERLRHVVGKTVKNENLQDCVDEIVNCPDINDGACNSLA